MRARNLSREQPPRSNTDKPNNNRVPLVVTYNPALPKLHEIIKQHQHILHTSPRCKDVFRESTMTAYRKGRNLTQIQTSKRLPPPSPSRSNQATNFTPYSSQQRKIPTCQVPPKLSVKSVAGSSEQQKSQNPPQASLC